MRRILLFVFWALSFPSFSAVYYVRTDGNNANTGLANDAAHAWLTIGKSASTMVAGDTVYVQPGTYNEQVTIGASGTAGSYINYVGGTNIVVNTNNPRAICRGFVASGKSRVRIIGFEITHVNTTFNYGVTFNNDCTFIEVLDNYIHNTQGQAQRTDLTGSNHIIDRGNEVYYTDFISGVFTNITANGLIFDQTGGYGLCEYNYIHRCGDVFIGNYGTNTISRNNWGGDFKNSYWGASGGNIVHSDIFQEGSDGGNAFCRNHMIEANFFGDCTEANSHYGIWQDQNGVGQVFGDTNIVIRGCVGWNYGSGGIGTFGTKRWRTYNNSFYDFCNVAGSGADVTIYAGGSLSVPATLAMCANSIADTVAGSTDPFTLQNDGCTGLMQSNLTFNTAASSGGVTIIGDPKFIDPTSPARNFLLQSNSPAIGHGSNVVWITSANGSGNSFTVNEPQLLSDGWGITDGGDGDIININGTITTITNINVSTSTVSTKDSVTWTNLMAVHWRRIASEDMGALPFGATKLTSATYTQNGTTYTVTPVGDARGVWFYVDGIPNTWVSSQPYQATISGSNVTINAYALYAQANPVVQASFVNNAGPSLTVSGQLNVSGALKVGQ